MSCCKCFQSMLFLFVWQPFRDDAGVILIRSEGGPRSVSALLSQPGPPPATASGLPVCRGDEGPHSVEWEGNAAEFRVCWKSNAVMLKTWNYYNNKESPTHVLKTHNDVNIIEINSTKSDILTGFHHQLHVKMFHSIKPRWRNLRWSTYVEDPCNLTDWNMH